MTDLVKVFLFKEGHREKYARLAFQPPEGYARERFEEIGERSIPWIERELKLSNPMLVVTQYVAQLAAWLRARQG